MIKMLALGLVIALASTAMADTPSQPQPDPSVQRPIPGDDAKCSTCDGVRLAEEGQYPRAIHVFQLQMAKGDGTAFVYMGKLYEQGLGEPLDYVQARKYYDEGAARGSGFAITSIGEMYQHGHGVPVDYAQALELYKQALSRGDPYAMSQIGFMYQHGLGLPKNLATAWCWYAWAEVGGISWEDVHFRELQAAGQQSPTECSAVNEIQPEAWRPATPQIVYGRAPSQDGLSPNPSLAAPPPQAPSR